MVLPLESSTKPTPYFSFHDRADFCQPNITSAVSVSFRIFWSQAEDYTIGAVIPALQGWLRGKGWSNGCGSSGVRVYLVVVLLLASASTTFIITNNSVVGHLSAYSLESVSIHITQTERCKQCITDAARTYATSSA